MRLLKDEPADCELCPEVEAREAEVAEPIARRNGLVGKFVYNLAEEEHEVEVGDRGSSIMGRRLCDESMFLCKTEVGFMGDKKGIGAEKTGQGTVQPFSCSLVFDQWGVATEADGPEIM